VNVLITGPYVYDVQLICHRRALKMQAYTASPCDLGKDWRRSAILVNYNNN